MTGYVRKDTTNNIADGNVINAADLDAEFDGVQAAFNASTGHKHDGTASEGATINALGPTQDVTISATLVAPKTTNFVDIGSSGLKFKDMFLAGNASIGGTLAVTGVATFTAQPILSSLTASRAVFSDGSKGLVSNAITGTGNVVMSASPTLTGTIGGASLTLSSLTSGRVTYAGTSGLLQDSANLLFNGTTLTANTLNLTNALGTTYGGTGLTSFTANGVVYASSSSALTTGSALTFNGSDLSVVGTISSANAGNENFYLSDGSVRSSLQNGANSLYFNVNVNSATSGSFVWRNTSSYVEQMRLTSTGLGIGTSSPDTKLDVVNPGLTAIFGSETAQNAYTGWKYNSTTLGYVGNGAGVVSGGGATDFAIGATGARALLFGTNDTERMRLDSSGNLGIGTSSPATKLEVYGATNSDQYWRTSAVSLYATANNTYASAIFGTLTNHPLIFYTNNAERMRLDASGNLLVGTTNSSVTSGAGLKFIPDASQPYMGIVGSSTSDSNVTYILYSTGAGGAYRFYVGYGGTIFATNTTISSISDVRLKENIRDLDDGLSAVMELKPRKFDWKSGKGKDIKGDRGFVAQEFEQVFPDMIDAWKDPAPEGEEPYKAVNANLIPTLVKAIQEQQAMIQSLTDRIAQLENKL